MALANIAELFYARGLRVLMVDFDLEAPGLERYFDVPGKAKFRPEQARARRGVIDLLCSYRQLRDLSPTVPPVGSPQSSAASFIAMEPLNNYVTPVYEGAGGRTLSLISAGDRSERGFSGYASRVMEFDWTEFYVKAEGERFFEWFREQAASFADVVLIDSRTGVTEMGGVCTHQLADVVVSFVGTNQQNLDGTLLMANSLSNPELIQEGRKGRPLELVFVPSRVEPYVPEKLDLFAAQFDHVFAPFFTKQLAFRRGPFLDLRIPYTPEYAYVEDVAARQAGLASKSDLVEAFERLAAHLAKLAPSESALFETYHPRTTSSEQLVRELEQYVASLTPEQQMPLRELFSRLIRIEEDNTISPRRSTLRDVTVAREMTRFVTVTQDGSDPHLYSLELVDPALARQWSRLKQWLDEDRDFLIWRQRLEAVCALWEQTRDDGSLLSGAALREAQQWMAERGDRLNYREAAFVYASMHVDEGKVTPAAPARPMPRRKTAVRWALLAAGSLAVIVVAFLWLGQSAPHPPRSAESPPDKSPSLSLVFGFWRLEAAGRLTGSASINLKPNYTYEAFNTSPAFAVLGKSGTWTAADDGRIRIAPVESTLSLDIRLLRADGDKIHGEDSSGAVQYIFTKQLAPIETVVKVNARAEKTGQYTGKIPGRGDRLPVQRYTLWINGSSDAMNRIGKVRYEFHHETFRQPVQESSDRDKQFAVSYTGWGCLNSVLVQFTLVQEPQTATVDFDMCAAIEDSVPLTTPSTRPSRLRPSIPVQ
jgi:hypothetical protein